MEKITSVCLALDERGRGAADDRSKGGVGHTLLDGVITGD